MKLENGILYSIELSDIKNGIFENDNVIEVKEECFLNIENLEKVILKNCTTIGNYNFYDCNVLTTIELPLVTTIGNDNFKYCNVLTTIELPLVTTIGNYNFYDCNALTTIELQNKKYKTKNIDSYLFVIGKTKKVKDIEILIGGTFLNFKENSINIRNEFIACKYGFYAHGITIKEAIKDCLDKIRIDKIKKEPIYLDTIITNELYHLLTGACDSGIKNWKIDNKMEDVNEITVKELLPILRKTNAYKSQQFEQLIKK